MRKIASNDDLMTTREAGEKLGVAVRTVQLWVEAGILPAWRTAGGHRRIARSAVEKLMAERSLVFTDKQLAEPGKKGAKEAAVLPVSPQFKLLLVEDDPLLLALFAIVVGRWDFAVELTTARNGFEGLVRIGEIHPNVVVTDLNMPGMDGFQMMRALQLPGLGFAALKVIAVSALTPQEVAERGGLPPDVAFLQKPIDYGRLEALVRSLVPAESIATKP